ncbi:periplakin [Callorhinchus milii]|uniref:periplakin n=1 Tax=Callorhinchus milii TaxID=7868 RepID=UPI00045754D5|nr:periplakin [Callorhinchus milii]|eukprot:gi/632973266/ref/XP_007903070.1/ PREDICTED: periplakin [Callorhinchus milii]
MFKSKKSSQQPKTKVPSELSRLIDSVQKKADIVENNIVGIEDNLLLDVRRKTEGKEYLYREATDKKIADSNELLKGLHTDAHNANEKKHPQGAMIVEDIKQLQRRVDKLKVEREKIYNTSSSPSINWSKLIDEKQVELNNKGFGNDLPSVEQQVEHHNVFSNEVEAIGDHINKNKDSQYISGLQVKYNKLKTVTKQRQTDLTSLRDYMQQCTNELYWMDTQQRDRMNCDFSDRNLDYKNRHRQYENFVNRNLEAKEATITKLHQDGNKLLEANHPGKNPIEAHMEAVHADWKEYLNLLICEENHLKNMEDYHKFHKDAKEVQDLLKRVDNDLDHNFNPEYKDQHQLQTLLRNLEDQDRALDKHEEVVKSLQKHSQQVLPLKFRRQIPPKPIPVEALCDIDAEGGRVHRGEKYSLNKKLSPTHWEVSDHAARKLNAPSVCFVIPPTDQEAVANADEIANQYKDIKQKMNRVKNGLQKRLNELKPGIQSATKSPALQPVSSVEDKQGAKLVADLNKINEDLNKQRSTIQSTIRPPLDNSKPLQDSNNRIQDLANISTDIGKLEIEKMSKERQVQAFLAQKPQNSSAPQLREGLDNTNQTFEDVSLLLNCSEEKVKAANRAVNSLRKGKTMISEYEKKLATERTVPEGKWGLDSRQKELDAMKSELMSKKPILQEAEQNVNAVKKNCQALANSFQEHCPDIEHQDSDMKKLNKRFDDLNKQITDRSKNLQPIKETYDDFRSESDTLHAFLANIPVYEPQPHDTIRAIESKLANQKRVLADISNKEPELKKTIRDAEKYQQAVKDYELETERFRSRVNPDNTETAAKKPRIPSPAEKNKDEEAALATKFVEVKAVNNQRLQNLQFAHSLLKQMPETEIVQQQNQSRNYSSAPDEAWQLQEGIKRRQEVEKELKEVKKEISLMESQKLKDQQILTEVIKKVPDPHLLDELYKVQECLADEERQSKALQDEMETVKHKLGVLDKLGKEPAVEYVTKEVLRIEPDREQENMVRQLKEDLEEVKRQKATNENDIGRLQKRLQLLKAEKNKDQEKITKQEVVKVKNDPKLEEEVKRLTENKKHESHLRQQKEEELNSLQEQLKRLEKEKVKAEERAIVKEVLKVGKDSASERELTSLQQQHENEIAKKRSQEREKADLQRKIQQLEAEKSKVVVQEKLREIVRPDPKAETEVGNLRHDLLNHQRKYNEIEDQVSSIQDEIDDLKNRGPKIEIKNKVKEVIKYKPDPETQRELENLMEKVIDSKRGMDRAEVEKQQLLKEIEILKNTKPQTETKEVVNELTQYREDPKTKEEVEFLKEKLAEEQKKYVEQDRDRMQVEEDILRKERDLAHIREKVVQQEVVKLEEDPVLKSECVSFGKEIEQEKRKQEHLKAQLQTLNLRKAELDEQLEELEAERRARRDAELEIKRLRIKVNDLEEKEREIRDKVVVKQKVVLQQDPQQEKEKSLLKMNLEDAKANRKLLEQDLHKLKLKEIELDTTKVKENLVFTEKFQVEKDPETELEIERLRKNLEEEGKLKHDLLKELNRLSSELSDAEFNNNKALKELDNLREENAKVQRENQNLVNEARRMQYDIQSTIQQTHQMKAEKPFDTFANIEGMEVRSSSLERELDDLKKKTASKDKEIKELQKVLDTLKIKREQRENSLRRDIVIIDPDTGKEMSPEEAHKFGFINWEMFVNLRSQECDWEEVSVKGPGGNSSILHDRKSGKRFSVDEALAKGKITNEQLKQYLNKGMSIQEFAVLVSGKDQLSGSIASNSSSIKDYDQVSSTSSSLQALPPKQSKPDETQTIGGVYDVDTDSKISVTSAVHRNLIDPHTAVMLLEAQAATGGIVNVNNGSRYKVRRAADLGLIDDEMVQKLSNAESAYTGIEDPRTKELLSAANAAQHHLLYTDAAERYLLAQYLTGGVVDPVTGERKSLPRAKAAGLIDEDMVNTLKDHISHPKDLNDPISHRKITYKDAMDISISDQESGLLLFPVSSAYS